MISFIKNYTNKILKCKPDSWTTRWPWVLFFGIVFHITLGAVVLVTEWDVRYDTQYEYWVSFISIFMVLALVFYLIYLLRFNVFKRFGKLSKWHYLGTFISYFGTIAIIVSWGYNPTAITASTARMQYDEKVIAKDINRINVLINTLEYDSIPHLWTRRKVVLDTSVKGQNYYNDDHYGGSAYEYAQDAVTDYEEDEYTGYIYKTDTHYEDRRISHKDSMSFYNMLATDSVQVINDTSYYRFFSADYTYVTNYHAFFNNHTETELDKVALFHKTVEHKPIIKNKEALQKELYTLIKTYWAEGYDEYGYKHPYHEPGMYKASDRSITCPLDYKLYIRKKYSLEDFDEGIKNISNRYYMWEWKNIDVLVYPMFYISMALSLLLFLFRHNRKKSFFYSILAGVLLFILTVTFLALSNSNSEIVLVIMLVYYTIFGIIAFGIFKAKRKTMLQDIAKNFFIYFTPILPLVITALYYDIKKDIFRANHLSSSPDYSELYSQAFKYQDIALIGSQFAGFILFLFLLHFVFSKMLRKSYALPES